MECVTVSLPSATELEKSVSTGKAERSLPCFCRLRATCLPGASRLPTCWRSDKTGRITSVGSWCWPKRPVKRVFAPSARSDSRPWQSFRGEHARHTCLQEQFVNQNIWRKLHPYIGNLYGFWRRSVGKHRSRHLVGSLSFHYSGDILT